MDKVNFKNQNMKLKRPSINNDIRFDNLNYKIFTINNTLKPGINYFKLQN